MDAMGFDASVGDPLPSDLPPELVESTDPAGGSRAAPKSKVVIHPGNGQGKNGQGQKNPGPGGPASPGPRPTRCGRADPPASRWPQGIAATAVAGDSARAPSPGPWSPGRWAMSGTAGRCRRTLRSRAGSAADRTRPASSQVAAGPRRPPARCADQRAGRWAGRRIDRCGPSLPRATVPGAALRCPLGLTASGPPYRHTPPGG
jgi:hypothetical protein